MSREAKALSPTWTPLAGCRRCHDPHVGARVEARYRATVLGKMGTKRFAASVRAVHGDGSYDVLYDDGDEENGGRAIARAEAQGDAPQVLPPPPASSRESTGETAVLDEDDDDGPISSRNKRKVKSTTVMVDGQRVKRSNMYDMEGGERSVWDQELGGGPSEYVDRRRARRRRRHRRRRSRSGGGAEAAERGGARAPERRNVISRGATPPVRARRLPAASPRRPRALRRQRAVGGGGGGRAGVPDRPCRRPAGGGRRAAPRLPARRAALAGGDAHVGHLGDPRRRDGAGEDAADIALLAHLKFEKGVDGPHLVVCPLSVPRVGCPSSSGSARSCAVKLHSSDAEERTRCCSRSSARRVRRRRHDVRDGQVAERDEHPRQPPWWRYRRRRGPSAAEPALAELGRPQPLPRRPRPPPHGDAAAEQPERAVGAPPLPVRRPLPHLRRLRRRVRPQRQPGAGRRRPPRRRVVAAAAVHAATHEGRGREGAAAEARDDDQLPALGDADVLVQAAAPPRVGAPRRARARGGRGGGDGRRLAEAQLAADAAAQVLQPPVPLPRRRARRRRRLVRRAAGGGERQDEHPRPAAHEAQGGRPPRRPLLAVHVDAQPVGGAPPVPRPQVLPPRRLDEPRAAHRRHQRVQHARLAALRLPDVDARRRAGDQPADGGHGDPVRLRLEPAGRHPGDGTRPPHRPDQGRPRVPAGDAVVGRGADRADREEEAVPRPDGEPRLDRQRRGARGARRAEMRSMPRFGTGCCSRRGAADRRRARRSSIARAPRRRGRRAQGRRREDGGRLRRRGAHARPSAAAGRDVRRRGGGAEGLPHVQGEHGRHRRRAAAGARQAPVEVAVHHRARRRRRRGQRPPRERLRPRRGDAERRAREGRVREARGGRSPAATLRTRPPASTAGGARRRRCRLPVGKKPKGSPPKREAGGGGSRAAATGVPPRTTSSVGSAADAKGSGMGARTTSAASAGGSAAAGGLLFRCAMCPRSFCEDHLPAEAIIMGECERFLALGARHPKQAATSSARRRASEGRRARPRLRRGVGVGGGDPRRHRRRHDGGAGGGGKKRAADGAAALAATQRDQRSDWERLRPREQSALDARCASRRRRSAPPPPASSSAPPRRRSSPARTFPPSW